MSRELRIGATEPIPDAPAFAVSRDSAGILIGVRDNAAPQFAVSRDADGLLLSAWPPPPMPYTVPAIERLGYPDYVRSWSNVGSWENARAGSEMKQAIGDFGGFFYVGARCSCEVYQAYLRFDTSVIPDDETVLNAVLAMSLKADISTTDFTIEARVYDAGDTVTTGDYVAGNDLSSKPLFATLSTVGGLPARLIFSKAAGAASAINKTGITGLLLCSDRVRTGAEPPTGDEYVRLISAISNIYNATLTITTSGPT